MEWMEAIRKSIQYMEEHITDDLTADMIAEYIRNRRLTLAGNDLVTGKEKIIDIALKYGYDSPDSFTRAFSRFHGVTPTAARKEQVMLKAFAPLKIKLSLEGGYLMDYKIVRKDAFSVIANARTFSYEGAQNTVPQFWQEHYKLGKGSTVMGVYGINIDEKMGHDTFEYLIADPYNPAGDKTPAGLFVSGLPVNANYVIYFRNPVLVTHFVFDFLQEKQIDRYTPE